MKLARRIIPCLDVANGKVVKGIRFKHHEIVGDIEQLALRYRDQGADELVFYDIGASPAQRSVDTNWVDRIAKIIDIPFCVAGGIRSVADAERVLHAGADKVSINSPALENPQLIDQLAKRFGSQCVVVGVDSLWVEPDWVVKQYTGDPAKTCNANRRTLDWIKQAVSRGAGEIVLNCMGSDGVKRGYDIDQLMAARAVCPVPLVASGGAGSPEHFYTVFAQADTDAALAASVFHRQEITIPGLKAYLYEKHIRVRLC